MKLAPFYPSDLSAGNNNEGKRYRFSRRESFLFVYLGSETRSRIAIIECEL